MEVAGKKQFSARTCQYSVNLTSSHPIYSGLKRSKRSENPDGSKIETGLIDKRELNARVSILRYKGPPLPIVRREDDPGAEVVVILGLLFDMSTP